MPRLEDIMKKVILAGLCYADSNHMSSELRKLFDVDVKSFTKFDEVLSHLNGKEKIDLIFVNRILAGDNRQGLELVEFLNKLKSKIPIILLTRHEDKQKEALEKGVAAAFDMDLIIGYVAHSKKEKRKAALEVLEKYLK